MDVVAVATDDPRIAAAAERAGATAIMTGPAATGTDRVAEAARKLSPAPEIVVNLQGDEPLIEPEAIETLLAAMAESGAEMGTLARPLEPGEAERPQVVKVVTDLTGHALYFSRALIPHRREGGVSPLCRAHVGIYAFTAPFLERFAQARARAARGGGGARAAAGAGARGQDPGGGDRLPGLRDRHAGGPGTRQGPAGGTHAVSGVNTW